MRAAKIIDNVVVNVARFADDAELPEGWIEDVWGANKGWHIVDDIPQAPATEFDLQAAIDQKITAINAHIKSNITSGFYSSALGSEYLYQSEEEDQLNLSGVTASGTDWPFKCSPDNGDTWQYLTHTSAQLQVVTKDGITHKLTHLQMGEVLKSQALMATTQAELDAIAW